MTKIIHLCGIKCDTSVESQDWLDLESDNIDDSNNNDDDDDNDDDNNNNNKNHKSFEASSVIPRFNRKIK